MVAVGDGGQGAASAPDGPAAGPPWHSVADSAPTISGAVRVTTGPRASQNGFDHDAQFQRAWFYTGRLLSVAIDIDRADPAADKLDGIRWGAGVSRSAGHLVVSLEGIGDGGIAILDHKQKGKDRPLVRAQACAGNATISVLMPIDGVITGEAELTAHSPELIAALNEVLDNLRPR